MDDTEMENPSPLDHDLINHDKDITANIEQPAELTSNHMPLDELESHLRNEPLSLVHSNQAQKQQNVQKDLHEENDFDVEADTEYREALKSITLKRRKGQASDEDEINFHRAQLCHDAHLQRVSRNIEDQNTTAVVSAEEDSLFVPEHEPRPDTQADLDFEEDMEPSRPKKRQSNSKQRGPKRRRYNVKKDTSQTTQNPSLGPRAQENAESLLKHHANNLTNMDDLIGSNVFKNAAKNTGHEENPSFQATTRREALKQLIGSIPEKDQDETSQMDLQQIKSHLKYFTPNGSCRSDGNSGWLVTGMISSLSHYQMLGVAWMRNREVQGESASGYHVAGGLIADAMGLGKTVMMIANIVNDGRTTRRKERPRCTLIVVPNSLLSQWRDEIKRHATNLKIGLQYSKACTVAKDYDARDLEGFDNFDICLTTYAAVCKDFPKYDPPASCITASQKHEWWTKHLQENQGPLLAKSWRRVVVDEAQAIKNHNSHTSCAVRALNARWRWAITGTPAQNSTREFYPYFKFLHVPGTGSFRVFKQNMCTEDDRGENRLAQLLKIFMLRRNHADTLLGAKLLPLPKTESQTVRLVFTPLERVLYQTVHGCFVRRINGFSRAGSLQQHHSHVLCMLLRLRQLVGHPLLIFDTLRDILEDQDYDELRKALDIHVAPDSSDEAILLHLRGVLEVERSTIPVMDHSVGSKAPASGRATATHPSATSTTDSVCVAESRPAGSDFAAYFEAECNKTPAPAPSDLASPRSDTGATLAFGPEPLTSEFAHYYCNAGRHAKNTSDSASTAMESQTSRPPAPKTSSAYGVRSDFRSFFDHLSQNRTAHEPQICCAKCGAGHPEDRAESNCGHVMCTTCFFVVIAQVQEAKKSDGGDGRLRCPKSDCRKHWSQIKSSLNGPKQAPTAERGKREGSSDKKLTVKQIVDTWVDKDGNMLSSTKTTAVKAKLLNIRQTDPGAKTIIYTSFTTMVYILAKICSLEDFGCEVLHGGMDLDARDLAIKRFRQDPAKVVLICTLKCGGVGLNLTMANRVILVDLWWNSSVEEQAFCRSYRRGQERETTFTRLVVSNTIDDDLDEMQQRKDEEIMGVMSGRCKNLSVQQLMQLFGTVETDEDNRPFVVADEPAGNAPSRGRLEAVSDDDDEFEGLDEDDA